QTLTLRLDGRWDSQQPTRVSPLGLPPTGGKRTERGGGVMVSLTSHFAGSLINEVRGYFSLERRDATALVAVPAGRVQVASDLPDGRQGVATLAFGGNGGLPQRVDNVGLELSEELSWLPGGGAHRPKLGALLSGTGLVQSQTPTALYGAALGAPGLSNAETELVCIGSAVPIPNWAAYASDPSTIPGQCADTGSTVAISPHPNVTAFARDYAPPHAWRASLGVQ